MDNENWAGDNVKLEAVAWNFVNGKSGGGLICRPENEWRPDEGVPGEWKLRLSLFMHPRSDTR